MLTNTKSPFEWSCDELCIWLVSIGYGALMPIFRQEQISGGFLLHILSDKDALQELGLMRKLDQRRLEYELGKVVTSWAGTTPQISNALQMLASAAAPAASSSSSSALITTNATTASTAMMNTTNPIKPTASKKRTSSASNSHPIKAEDNTGLPLPLSLPTPSTSHKKPRKSIGKDTPLVNVDDGTISTDIITGSTLTTIVFGDDDFPGDHNTTTTTSPAKPPLESIPVMSFEYAKSSRAKCRSCEEMINKGDMKIGLRSFYFTRGTTFPTFGWYHLSCGIELKSSLAEDLDSLLDCKECKSLLIIAENPVEQLATIVGKPKKREVICMACVTMAMQDSNNVGLESTAIEALPGFVTLPITLQEHARCIFKQKIITDTTIVTEVQLML